MSAAVPITPVHVQWQGDEPYLELPGGFRVTPYRHTDEEIARIIELSNEPTTAATSLRRPYPYVRADAETWLASHTVSDEQREAIRAGSPLRTLPFDVIRQGDGAFIGDVGLAWEEDEDGIGAWTLGYTLMPAYHGRGITSSAVAALIGWVRQYWPGEVVHAVIEPRNAASIGIARKLGFKRVGERIQPWSRGPPREVQDWHFVM